MGEGAHTYTKRIIQVLQTMSTGLMKIQKKNLLVVKTKKT